VDGCAQIALFLLDIAVETLPIADNHSSGRFVASTISRFS
jgi:hypothetical protein